MDDAPALVIAWGNPGRRDDGAAWVVADRLRQALPPGAPVEILVVCQLGPELAEPLSRARRVVFVDASVEAEGPGVTVRPVAPEAAPAPGLTHSLPPDRLLALAAALYGRAPEAHLVTVRAHDLDFGDTLSAATAALVGPATARVLERVLDRAG